MLFIRIARRCMTGCWVTFWFQELEKSVLLGEIMIVTDQYNPVLTKSDIRPEDGNTIVFSLDSLAKQQGWADPLSSGNPNYLWMHQKVDILIARPVLASVEKMSFFLSKVARSVNFDMVRVYIDDVSCHAMVKKRGEDICLIVEIKDSYKTIKSLSKFHCFSIHFNAAGSPRNVFSSSLLKDNKFSAQIRKVGASLLVPFDLLEASDSADLVNDTHSVGYVPGDQVTAAVSPLAGSPKCDQRCMVFTLGQGGYDRAFARAVKTQRVYSARHGYAFTCIFKSGDLSLGRENIWLKALAIYGALLENEYVLYADTDVAISEDCPPLTDAVSDENPIGLVAGHSGRVNAGVIIAKRTPASLAFFAEWIKSLGMPLAARHDVGWGENGHLIRLALKHRISLLDTRWNNTFRPELDDYMRHYTGPMRSHYDFDDDENIAWEMITGNVEASKALEAVDPISSFARLGRVYARTVPSEGFAPFDGQWIRSAAQTAKASPTGQLQETRLLRGVYLAEPIVDDSPNAYVLTLRNGLYRLLGRNAVSTGIDRFWHGHFETGEVLHIEWLESLFSWKIPNEEQISQFEMRMAEISRKIPILYTAHNFDLMPTYGESRARILKAVADHATMICHLSSANIDPYNRHHAAIPGLRNLPTAVVPHGDYQPYFTPDNEAFKDPALETNKTKILVFGHIRTAKELDFCLKTADELGDQYQMIISGTIHSEILHWKEVKSFQENWDGNVRRIHIKVPNAQVRSLVSQCDGLLVPRFERLNSGVQFLAYSMLKPAFVPLQNSMMEIGAHVNAAELYQPHDAASASEAIRITFAARQADILAITYRRNAFNYRSQDNLAVARAHYRAYENALSLHQSKG